MHQLELVVYHRGQVRVFGLPTRGTVAIGRDAEQAIRIDDPSVSRRHLTLTLDGERVLADDEGSANGTMIVRGDGKEVEEAVNPVAATAKNTSVLRRPMELQPSDSICIGGAVLALRRAARADTTAMAALDRMVRQIAPAPIRVLLLGETGVGKEVLAERIHSLSARATQPLVRVHCAALSESLLESELFGHEKGAFTGAVRARTGLIEAAQKGTLFLDEVGEMSPATQVKLLRVLEDGRVQPVGSSETRQVDVRVVSATNRELAREVEEGSFRKDLYFRLNGITLRIPPLRERRDEIAALATELLERGARQAGRSVPTLSDEALARLHGHTWPGNVRELRQVIDRALALTLTTDAVIGAEHVLLDEPAPSSIAPSSLGGTLREDMQALERQRVEDALARCGGNQSRAAALLRMPRRTLVERLRAWRMTGPRSKA